MSEHDSDAIVSPDWLEENLDRFGEDDRVTVVFAHALPVFHRVTCTERKEQSSPVISDSDR